VKRHGGDPNRLLLYAQESKIATYNISRINMILHGVPSWNHRQGDSIRDPTRLPDEGNRLLKFDRVVMNPPFSLEDWGYDDLVGGDPHQRFELGMPPRDNGDYAWLQQVAKSLKDDGKAIIVMSQGVLFRGQPEQTEEEDGRNQKPDAEYIIREGFVKSDLIECVIVLPSKLFYGNNVPGCLIVLNKRKAPELEKYSHFVRIEVPGQSSTVSLSDAQNARCQIGRGPSRLALPMRARDARLGVGVGVGPAARAAATEIGRSSSSGRTTSYHATAGFVSLLAARKRRCPPP
jgi:type I restriction-modification system DNA methylase subunit